MYFKDEKHKQTFFDYWGRVNNIQSNEYIPLLYILSSNDTFRDNIDSLYDFKNRWIKSEGLNKAFHTGSSRRLTRLAFNLYNGFVDEDEPGQSSPYWMFWGLDEQNTRVVIQAMKLAAGLMD